MYSNKVISTQLLYMTEQDVFTVVASDESIAILILQLAIDIFFCLFQCNVHVTIEACEHSYNHKIISSACIKQPSYNNIISAHAIQCQPMKKLTWKLHKVYMQGHHFHGYSRSTWVIHKLQNRCGSETKKRSAWISTDMCH